MKKIIILLVAVLVCSWISAEDGFYSRGEFSYFFQNTEYEAPNSERYNYDKDSLLFFSSVTIGADWEFLFAEAQTDFFIIKDDEGLLFNPSSADFFLRGGIKYKFISIEYEHLCKHSFDGVGVNGGHDRVSIKFNSKY